MFAGEFTMLELAETVKEVCSVFESQITVIMFVTNSCQITVFPPLMG